MDIDMCINVYSFAGSRPADFCGMVKYYNYILFMAIYFIRNPLSLNIFNEGDLTNASHIYIQSNIRYRYYTIGFYRIVGLTL